MITSKLTEQLSLTEINPAAKNSAGSQHAEPAVKKINDIPKNSADAVIIHKKHFELFNTQPAYSKINLMAATVRSADETMQKIDEQIEQMKNRLMQYVKYYPPFGQNNPERVKLLKRSMNA